MKTSRRSFLTVCVSWLACTPVVGKLFDSAPTTKPVAHQIPNIRVRGQHPAMARLKKSIEFHKHMTLPGVGSTQDARDYYLSLARREKEAEWSGAEITYGNGSSRKDEWAHTFGQGPPAGKSPTPPDFGLRRDVLTGEVTGPNGEKVTLQPAIVAGPWGKSLTPDESAS